VVRTSPDVKAGGAAEVGQEGKDRGGRRVASRPCPACRDSPHSQTGAKHPGASSLGGGEERRGGFSSGADFVSTVSKVIVRDGRSIRRPVPREERVAQDPVELAVEGMGPSLQERVGSGTITGTSVAVRSPT